MITRTDEDILFWYQKNKDFESSGMNLPQFCRTQSIDSKKLYNMRRVLVFKKYCNPEEHVKLINLSRQMTEQGLTRIEAAKLGGVKFCQITEATAYLSYQRELKRILEERGLPFDEDIVPMEFIEVGNKPQKKPKQALNRMLQQKFAPVPAPIEPEIVEQKNDVELIIQKGVRVLVSPEVGTDKLIKIIELLKDL
jgi:hypothetical protein